MSSSSVAQQVCEREAGLQALEEVEAGAQRGDLPVPLPVSPLVSFSPAGTLMQEASCQGQSLVHGHVQAAGNPRRYLPFHASDHFYVPMCRDVARVIVLAQGFRLQADVIYSV